MRGCMCLCFDPSCICVCVQPKHTSQESECKTHACGRPGLRSALFEPPCRRRSAISGNDLSGMRSCRCSSMVRGAESRLPGGYSHLSGHCVVTVGFLLRSLHVLATSIVYECEWHSAEAIGMPCLDFFSLERSSDQNCWRMCPSRPRWQWIRLLALISHVLLLCFP
jgi:hypothetical protein